LDEFKAIVAGIKSAPASNSSNSSSASAPAPIPAPAPFVPEVKPVVEVPKETPVPSAPIAIPVPSAPADPSAHEASLVALESMGFSDKARNLAAIERAKGDLVVAVQILVDEQRAFRWF